MDEPPRQCKGAVGWQRRVSKGPSPAQLFHFPPVTVSLRVSERAAGDYDGLALASGRATLAPAMPVLLLGGDPAKGRKVSRNVRLLHGAVAGAELLHHARLALAS